MSKRISTSLLLNETDWVALRMHHEHRQGGGVSTISGEPSLENDELSDDALAGIGIDAAGILGDEDIGGALEGSEELEIARLQREIANSVQSNPKIVVELMRTWLDSEDET